MPPLQLFEWPPLQLADPEGDARRAALACRAMDDDLIDIAPLVNELDDSSRVVGGEEYVARTVQPRRFADVRKDQSQDRSKLW